MVVLIILGLNTDKRSVKLSNQVRIHEVGNTDHGGRLKVETPPAPGLHRALRCYKTSVHLTTLSGSQADFVVLLPRNSCSGL